MYIELGNTIKEYGGWEREGATNLYTPELNALFNSPLPSEKLLRIIEEANGPGVDAAVKAYLMGTRSLNTDLGRGGHWYGDLIESTMSQNIALRTPLACGLGITGFGCPLRCKESKFSLGEEERSEKCWLGNMLLALEGSI